jgi:hypothetical protein
MSDYGTHNAQIKDWLIDITMPNKDEALMFAAKVMLPKMLVEDRYGSATTLTLINAILTNKFLIESMSISQEEFNELFDLMKRYEKLASFA